MPYTEEYQRVAALHERPTFVSGDFAIKTIIPFSITVIVGVSILHFISSKLITNILLPNAGDSAQRKASYQVTNLSVNAIIGLTGLYYYMYKMPSNATLEQKVEGLEELYPLTCMQIGFQLWALPVGIFWIKEPLPMLGHHVAVIMVAMMAAFCNMGFRYFTPLMVRPFYRVANLCELVLDSHCINQFGMMELSSVPLALMNLFKDNPPLIQKYPSIYSTSRATFALAFLSIRWYMVFPPMFEFLRLLGYSTFSYPSMTLKCYHFFVWTFAHFLALLQIFWGSLIVKGIVNTILPKKKTNVN